VENILAIDGTEKIRNEMTKFILRVSMKGILPEKIRLRKDKIGFGTPQDGWFRTKLFKDLILEILDSELLKKRNIIDIQKAKELFMRYLNREINIYKEIWKWLYLELWFREVFD